MAWDADVVVAGGGLTGATAALALAREGLRTVVVDAQPPSAGAEADGRASFVAFGPFRLWRTLGVADRLAAAQRVDGMVVTDGAAGAAAPAWSSAAWLGFDPRELAGPDAGEPLGWMVENREAAAALRGALAEAGVEVVAPAVVERAVPDKAGTTVDIRGAASVRAALIVAADGRDSRLRAAAGIGATGWPYDQSALAATVEHDRPHDGVARQIFLPSGPVAALPLAGGNRSSLVWAESPARADALARLPAEAFEALLQRRLGDALGALRLVGPRWAHPLRVQLAERFTADRLALAGDAACSVHPLAGQGLNLGLKDAAALADVLGEAFRVGEDPGSAAVLDRYARRRRFDAAALASATDGLRRVYASRNPLVRAARTLGVAAADRTPMLRRLFMREAGGVAGAPATGLQ